MQPTIHPSGEHTIDPDAIDRDALFVLKKLRDAGFTAYLVGGSVRDLLVKRLPKDYDISTSAKPEEIKQLFNRNCILIGRRFRLAHIRFGHKILEVATFRSGENDDDLIVHDNQWGSPAEDVLRRDFTINGLFYDAETNSIIDYVDGLKDIKAGILKTIGEPKTRFRQDPVRMIRLLKFQARFGFKVADDVNKALIQCKDEILKSSPARILEEILRMLESGSSSLFFSLMKNSGILEHLFPCITHFLESEHGVEVFHYLAMADQYNLRGRYPLDRAVLTSCLLYPILEQEIRTQFLEKNEMPHIGDIMMLSNSLIDGFVTSSFSHFPRRLSSTMGFILAMQYKLTPLSGKRHPRPKLVRNKEFNLALNFLKVRSLVNVELVDTYNFWKEILRQAEHHHDKKAHAHPAPHKS